MRDGGLRRCVSPIVGAAWPCAGALNLRHRPPSPVEEPVLSLAPHRGRHRSLPLPVWLERRTPGLLPALPALLVLLGGPVLLYLQIKGFAVLLLPAVVGALAVVLIWARPQAAFLVALALGASVFPEAPKYLDASGPIHTDLVEIIALLLLSGRCWGGWLTRLLGRRSGDRCCCCSRRRRSARTSPTAHASGFNEATPVVAAVPDLPAASGDHPAVPRRGGQDEPCRAASGGSRPRAVSSPWQRPSTGTPLDAAAQGAGRPGPTSRRSRRWAQPRMYCGSARPSSRCSHSPSSCCWPTRRSGAGPSAA